MRKQIQIQIDSAREKIHALEIERAKLDTRLETLLEMLDMAPPEEGRPKKTRRRSLSEHWQNVLYLMATEKPEGASYDDIYDIINRVGFNMKKANLRGHMGGYKSSGYVSAVSDGVFVVTTEGKKQTKKPEKEEPATEVAGSKDTGAVTGRDSGLPPARPSGSIPDASTDISTWERQKPDLDDEIPF